MAVDALKDGEQVEGVVAWTKQGRFDIEATMSVDASGDADVAALAGLETFVGREGSVQNPTMIFRLMGVDVARFRGRYGEDTILGNEVSQMIRNLHNSREYDRAPRCSCSRHRGLMNCSATAPGSSAGTGAS